MKEIKNPVEDKKKDEYGDKFYHVKRGGGCYTYPYYMRASSRNYDDPTSRYNYIGFRIVRNQK